MSNLKENRIQIDSYLTQTCISLSLSVSLCVRMSAARWKLEMYVSVGEMVGENARVYFYLFNI